MAGTILVTGGAGYVGYTVVEELAKRYPESKIAIYDNFSKGKVEGIGSLKKRWKNIDVIPWEKADIRDADNIESAIKEFKPEVVVHLAAIVDAFTTNREGKDRECEIVNYESAVSLAKISKDNGVKKFIYQSTVSLYSRGEELKENASKEPLSMYGKAKLWAEIEILKMNDPNFSVIALRPATVVGYNPAFRYETIINLACARAIYKIPINVFESAMYGNKTYLYVKDNARAIIFAIENAEKMKGESFNISSFHVNLDTVLKILKSKLKEDFPYYMTPQKSINQQVYTINSDKIKNLGFMPIGTIEGTIEETIFNLKKCRNFFGDFR